MKKYRLANNESGATAVEFALVLPVILIFVFGIIEFGLLMFNKQVLTNACREGARAGVVVRSPRNQVNEDAEIRAMVLQYARDYLVTFGAGGTLSSDDIVIEPANRCLGFEDADGNRCFLIVTVDYLYTFLYMSNFGIGPLNIQAVSRMQME
jgi:hypothetical protein